MSSEQRLVSADGAIEFPYPSGYSPGDTLSWPVYLNGVLVDTYTSYVRSDGSITSPVRVETTQSEENP